MTFLLYWLFAAVLGHHLLPEDHDGRQVVLLDFFIPLTIVGAGDQHLGRDQAEFVEVLLVEQGRRLVLGDQLGLVGVPCQLSR